MNETFLTNWKSQIKKGTLSFIILNILKEDEYYGYELIEKIRKHTEIEIAEGTLYPLMNRLKNENLVNSKWIEQETGIPRKYYCLTEIGLKSINQMNEYWENLEESIIKLLGFSCPVTVFAKSSIFSPFILILKY